MQDGKNLNPIVQQNPSKQLEDFERIRLAKEMRYFGKSNGVETPTKEFDIDTDSEEDEIDAYEVFDMLRHINDPEHPLTLEQLKVIKPEQITIDRVTSTISVKYTPTIPNCSMATLIGLMLRVKLYRSLPARYKVDVNIQEGKHDQETDINKQLNDKERVYAALENAGLLNMVNKGLLNSERDLNQYLVELGINE